jgi:16S rRNA (guanine527-N7)-methyltransferase
VTLSEDRIATLLQPYLPDIIPPANLYAHLSAYLDLLLRWNARTNLTAIRDPEQIVQRHFGESLFVGAHLASIISASQTLLDFGSGAGFPGLPIQLLLPKLRVTLSESQGKKSTFLREATRTLGLDTKVWAGRVEAMPVESRFDVVALRAVDKMESALAEASLRVASGGILAILGGKDIAIEIPTAKSQPLPGNTDSFLYIEQR